MDGARSVPRYLRQYILFLMRLTGLIGLFRFLHRNRIVILMIHGVMDEEDRSSWTPLWRRVSRNKLDQYLRVLSKRYRFVSLMDAVEMLQGRKPVQPYSLVLTFDDGYRNNITHALPILRRYRAPATFFVPTGFVDHPRPLWYDRLDHAIQHAPPEKRELRIGSFGMVVDYSNREALHESFIRFVRTAQKERMSDSDFLREMDGVSRQLEAESGQRLSDVQKDDHWSAAMTWEQIAKEAREGVSFGSHTVDHIRLGLVDAPTVQDQLVRSKQAIELHTGTTCPAISFPNGSFTDETITLAIESGYVCGLTTIEGTNRVGDDVMRLRRIALPASASVTDLLLRLSDVSLSLSSPSRTRLKRKERDQDNGSSRGCLFRQLSSVLAKTWRIMAYAGVSVQTRGFRGATKRVAAELCSKHEFLVLRHSMDFSAPTDDSPSRCKVYQVTDPQTKDLDDLSRAWPAELGRWRPKYLKLKLARDLANDDWCFIARLDGNVVGAVWLSKGDNAASSCGIPHHPDERVVRSLFVVSQARGRGVSKQLLHYAGRVARDKGIPQLLSLILPEREPSLRAHISVGFAIVGGVKMRTRLGRSRYEFTAAGPACTHGGIIKDPIAKSQRMIAIH